MIRASKAVRPTALAATGLLLAVAAATVQPHPAAAAAPLQSQTAAAPTAATPKRVLFDNTKGETAGNADWIISTSQPDPLAQNANPATETSWTGALSAWGVALQKAGGYSLKTLPAGNTISYGTGGALDLANFDAFVLPEPNVRLGDAEKTAVMKFVQNGGGLFLISDHTQSDRNNDGWDSPKIINDLLTTNSVDSTDPFGFSVDLLNLTTDNPRAITDTTDPVLNGPFGKVTGSIIRNGTTFTLKPADNPNVKGLLYRTGYSGSTGAAFATSTFGSGRVAIWGDSSPIDDGTGQSGNTLYDGWNDPAGTDAALALNTTAWLAKSTGTGTGGGGTGCPAAQLIANPGFETGSTAGWTETNSDGTSTVNSGNGEPARTGSYDAWLDGNGATTTDTLSQTVTLPTGCAGYRLSFWLHIDSAASTTTAFDTLTVTANGTTLAGYDNTKAAAGYQQRTFDLAAYAGRSVTLKFTGAEDYTKQTSFVLDDITVDVS